MRRMALRSFSCLVMSSLAVVAAPNVARAQTAVCVKVKLEIPQRLSFERDAFDAQLGLTNNLNDATLDELSVELQFRNMAGERVDGMFFLQTPRLVGISAAIAGTGVLMRYGILVPRVNIIGVKQLVNGLFHLSPQIPEHLFELLGAHPVIVMLENVLTGKLCKVVVLVTILHDSLDCIGQERR